MKFSHLFDRHRTCLHMLNFAACALATMVGMAASGFAAVVSFGSGANQFSMEFVTIGNPNNAADTTGAPNPAGAVGYEYGIGKFEVSEDMIKKFNASQSFQISLADLTAWGGNGPNKPATEVSWDEAARFVNWLNTSTGGSAAYNFTTTGGFAVWTAADTLDYDSANPYRSKRATYVLPSYNEWYKAAYYDPSNSTYYDFSNGSDTAPTAVASGTVSNTAVYNQGYFQGPADINQAGGLSPYGVMGLGGNVFEWEESSFDLTNSSGNSSRGIRGGDWHSVNTSLLSSFRINGYPGNVPGFMGFRVASLASGPAAVPEPTSIAIFGLGALGMAYRARRKIKCKT